MKDKLKTEFNFTDEQIEAVLKLPAQVVQRAFDMTHLFHPGDKSKFKEFLRFFS